MTRIEEMGWNILPYKNVNIFDVVVRLVGCGYLADVESKLLFHHFKAANSQTTVSLVHVDEIFVMSICVTKEVEKRRVKGGYRPINIVCIDQ